MVVKKKSTFVQLYREMEYLQQTDSKPTLEHDAIVRFYAMLNILVTFKGRETYDIEKPVMDIKIKQPLEMAFYKLFQAMLNFPSNKSTDELTQFTCHDVLLDETERVQEELGLKKVVIVHTDVQKGSRAEKQILDRKKARESRMKIYEDTIGRFYTMLELYTPYKMRPRLWDEQVIPEEQWNTQIKLPIREAFKAFISVMRNYPTKIRKQQELVNYTLQTILPNCETGMSERGLRYMLAVRTSTDCTCHTGECAKHRRKSVWDPEDDDMKVALGYQRDALRFPSDCLQSKQAMAKYNTIYQMASRAPSKDVIFTLPSQHKHRLYSTKSQLQNIPSQEKHTPTKDFSWVKTDGHRVINQSDFPGSRTPFTSIDVASTRLQSPRPRTSYDTRSREEDSNSRFIDEKYAPSSSTTVSSCVEEDVIIETKAISYRPVFSAKQKAIVRPDNLTGPDPLYECFSRQVTGYPLVHSKRRREVKSASVYERRMQRQAGCSSKPATTRPGLPSLPTLDQLDNKLRISHRESEPHVDKKH